MAELWQVFIDEVLPRNDDFDWDYVKMEFWSDSGRVIVYPASSRSKWRDEKAGCTVTFPDLIATVDRIADSYLDDDEEYDRRIQEVLVEWANELERTARVSTLTDIRILIFEADDPDPIGEFSIP